MADAVDTAKKGVSGVFNFAKKAITPVAVMTTIFSVAAFAIDGGLSQATLAAMPSGGGFGGVIEVPKEGAMELWDKVSGLFSSGTAVAATPGVSP